MARLREARASKDVDITTKESLDAAERVLREAAGTSTGDFLRFQIDEEADLSSTTGKKFRVTVFCGAHRLSSFKMDLSIAANFPDPEELDIAPRIESIDIPGLCDIGYPAWPFSRVVADKVAASLQMHDGTPSSRYRDLADLYLIQAQVSFDRRQLREAVLAELAGRKPGTPLRILGA